MPSPRNGAAGAVVSPAGPKPAQDADHADPGRVEKLKAGQREENSGKYGAREITPHKTAADGESDDPRDQEQRKHWIEIELVDKQNRPVPGEPYRVTLPDGTTTAEGTLDEKGFTRVDGIEAGMCKIGFPRLEKAAWKAK